MKFIKKNLKWLTIALLFLGIITFIIFKIYLSKQAIISEEILIDELEITEEESKEKLNEELIEEIKTPEEIKKIFIDIKGAVTNPGVYEIEENKKVIDAVNLAGGFTKDANTTLINLAKQLKNEMVIIIYTNKEVEKASQENPIIKVIDKECVCPQIKNDACLEQEKPKDSTTKTENNTSSSEQINLNTATKEELETLPGIGASKADAIIKYREEVGAFKKIEELKEVTGIGESLYEKVKDYLTI